MTGDDRTAQQLIDIWFEHNVHRYDKEIPSGDTKFIQSPVIYVKIAKNWMHENFTHEYNDLYNSPEPGYM